MNLVFQVVIVPFMLRKWNALIFAQLICKQNQSINDVTSMVCWLVFSSSSPHFDLDININVCFHLVTNVISLLLDDSIGIYWYLV